MREREREREERGANKHEVEGCFISPCRYVRASENRTHNSGRVWTGYDEGMRMCYSAFNRDCKELGRDGWMWRRNGGKLQQRGALATSGVTVLPQLGMSVSF